MIQATWRYLKHVYIQSILDCSEGLEGCKKMCWDAWRFATSECSRDAAGRDVRSMVAIHILRDLAQSMPSWWFQMFHVFTPTWGKDPIWLIFFNWLETTKQIPVENVEVTYHIRKSDRLVWVASKHPRISENSRYWSSEIIAERSSSILREIPR